MSNKAKAKVVSKAKPGVKITLDKERTLKLDLNAMVAFEEATGKSFAEGSFARGEMSPRDLRAILWACLIHEDEALTLKQAGSWVTASNMVEVAAKLNEAFEVALPESEGKQAVPLVANRPRG